jgi:hypothetical protein
MRASEPLAYTPHQFHALHPDECFVCRGAFLLDTRTHEETGARTCSPLCSTRYQRWWLRKRSHLRAVASPADDAEAR